MLTQAQIQQRIEELQDRIENLAEEIRAAGHDAAVAETDYEVAFAQQRLLVRWNANEENKKVTAPTVDDEAVVATAELRRKALLARNNLSTLKEAMAAAKTNMDGLRTLAASHRNIV
jgi:hypothetical protein